MSWSSQSGAAMAGGRVALTRQLERLEAASSGVDPRASIYQGPQLHQWFNWSSTTICVAELA